MAVLAWRPVAAASNKEDDVAQSLQKDVPLGL